MPTQGAANDTYAVGDDRVLRVARAGHEADLATETVVLPIVREAGVPVPVLLDHLPAQGRVRASVLLTRCHGTSLDDDGLAPDVRRAGYRDLGAVLRHLHDAALGGPAGVPVDPQGDPHEAIRDLRARGWLGTPEAGWPHGWFAALDPFAPEQPPAVLLHGDAAPQNVLVDPASGAVQALLDWGDAAVSDPAVDLAKIPPPHLPDAVAGYVRSRGAGRPAPGTAEAEVAWAARVLRHQLAWALGRLPTAPRPEDASWSAPPAARLLHLMQLVTGPLPDGWDRLRPPAPP